MEDWFEQGKSLLNKAFKIDVFYLNEAIRKNDISEVKELVKGNCPLDEKDHTGFSPLEVAIKSKNTIVLEYLLKHGANPNQLDDNQNSMLWLAVSLDFFPAISVLLSYGAKPLLKKRKNRQSAMGLAIQKDKHQFIQLFHEHIALQKYEDNIQHEKQSKRIVEINLENETAKKAEQEEEEHRQIQKYGFVLDNPIPALKKAIKEKDSSAIHLFVEKSNIEVLNKSDILSYLLKTNNEKIIFFLLEKGINPFVLKATGHSFLTECIVSKNDNILKEILLLPKAKEEINNPEYLLSPLFLSYANAQYWKWLLAAGAKPQFGGQQGSSPMIKAIEKGSLGILMVWLSEKIDLQQTVNGKTLLEWADIYGRKDWSAALQEELHR